ncbi:MAG: DUF5615 family PIN-like protein [Myxococcota bacterium]
MKLLLDQGLARSTASRLRESNILCTHVGEIGLAKADDEQLIIHARRHGFAIVTLDADFHALLAQSGEQKPSVIRIRVEGLKAEATARLLLKIVEEIGRDLEEGAAVSVNDDSVRVRRLPIC